MRIVIELPDPQAEKLRAEAQRLGVRLEELARPPWSTRSIVQTPAFGWRRAMYSRRIGSSIATSADPAFSLAKVSDVGSRTVTDHAPPVTRSA